MSRYDHKIETSLEGIADDKTLLHSFEPILMAGHFDLEEVESL